MEASCSNNIRDKQENNKNDKIKTEKKNNCLDISRDKPVRFRWRSSGFS